MIDYGKRLVEVDEILEYLSEEDLLKIPEDVRKTIKENKDKDYIWKYDESKSLIEQEINRDTIAFLSYLNMEYILNETQKKGMMKLYELNEKKIEQSKSEKYNEENLFKENIVRPKEFQIESEGFPKMIFSKKLKNTNKKN